MSVFPSNAELIFEITLGSKVRVLAYLTKAVKRQQQSVGGGFDEEFSIPLKGYINQVFIDGLLLSDPVLPSAIAVGASAKCTLIDFGALMPTVQGDFFLEPVMASPWGITKVLGAPIEGRFVQRSLLISEE